MVILPNCSIEHYCDRDVESLQVFSHLFTGEKKQTKQTQNINTVLLRSIHRSYVGNTPPQSAVRRLPPQN